MFTSTIPRSIALPAIKLTRVVALMPLFAILALQTIIALSLRNTAFQDEALYLYAGRQFFDHLMGGPPVIEPYQRYFSGLPYLYPLVAGGLDSIGGLEAARMLSLGCMLLATVMVYLITTELYGRDSAIFAAALFVAQSSVIFISRLATYDAPCLALLALAAWLTLRASGPRWLVPTVLIGPLIGLAVATKYAGALFGLPIIALFFLHTWSNIGWRSLVLRAVLALASTLAVAGLVFWLFQDIQDVLIGLRSTTTERVALFQVERLTLLTRVVTIGGALFALGVVGLLLGGRARMPLAIILVGAALLAPAYHIFKTESVSMHKHIAFGMFFAAPVAGYAIVRLSGYGRNTAIGQRWLAGLAIMLVVFGTGLSQAQGFYAEWADSDALIHVLRTQVRPEAGRILAEETEVPRYYLQDIASFWQWNSLYVFDYTDRSGQQLSGEAAYKAAIADGYFDLVVLQYGANANKAHAIDQGLRDNTGYEQIAKLPYTNAFGTGDYWVWRKR